MAHKITFTNSMGNSIVLGPKPFRVVRIDGTGGTGADIQTQKVPYQDGHTFVDVLLEPKTIGIELTIFARSKEEVFQLRRQLTNIFNPKLGVGLLTYEYPSGVREIEAVPDGVPAFPSGRDNRGSFFQKAMVNLLCPNPYWKSPEITEEPTFEPLFQFPFEGVFQIGIQRDKRIIVNDGDAPAPLYIEFYGPAVNPIIINRTTGEYIKVNQTIGENEVMKIDTTPGQKSVVFVGPNGKERNVFHWIDLGSTFFQLVIGENEIEYSADSDIQGAIVNVSYRKLYNAV